MSTKTNKQKLIMLSSSRLGKYELGELVSDFLSDFDKKQLAFDADLTPFDLIETLRKANALYSSAMNQAKVESQTKLIKEADDNRDKDWQAFYHTLQAKKYARGETERAAYTSLNELVKPYKAVMSENYAVATAKYKQFLEYSKDAVYKKHLGSLNLLPLVENLKNSQAEFEQLYTTRLNNNLNKVTYDIQKLKKELETAYKNLTDYCALLGRIKDDAIYQELIIILNNSRKVYAEMLHRRGKRDKADAPENIDNPELD